MSLPLVSVRSFEVIQSASRFGPELSTSAKATPLPVSVDFQWREKLEPCGLWNCPFEENSDRREEECFVCITSVPRRGLLSCFVCKNRVCVICLLKIFSWEPLQFRCPFCRGTYNRLAAKQLLLFYEGHKNKVLPIVDLMPGSSSEYLPELPETTTTDVDTQTSTSATLDADIYMDDYGTEFLTLYPIERTRSFYMDSLFRNTDSTIIPQDSYIVIRRVQADSDLGWLSHSPEPEAERLPLRYSDAHRNPSLETLFGIEDEEVFGESEDISSITYFENYYLLLEEWTEVQTNPDLITEAPRSEYILTESERNKEVFCYRHLEENRSIYLYV